jgi:hypothetical protein
VVLPGGWGRASQLLEVHDGIFEHNRALGCKAS